MPNIKLTKYIAGGFLSAKTNAETQVVRKKEKDIPFVVVVVIIKFSLRHKLETIQVFLSLY